MDPDNDRKISEHVLRMHRYRKPGEQEGEGESRINSWILPSDAKMSAEDFVFKG